MSRYPLNKDSSVEKKGMRWNPFQRQNAARDSDRSNSVDSNTDESIRGQLPKRGSSASLTSSASSVKSLDDRFKDIMMEHEISEKLARRLRVLADYDIILLCDDSGSMNTLVDGSQRTRWDELKSYVETILDVATIFHPGGIDTFFLNRSHITLTDRSQVEEAFAVRPKGVTPLVDALRYIFRYRLTQRSRLRKKLIFIATDGAPTDRQGTINVDVLKKVMNDERKVNKTFVTFLICTDDDACVEYLNDWDETMVNVDVVDDFRTEREQIWREQGRNYPFSKGEYIVKALIGAIDPEIGLLDGKKKS